MNILRELRIEKSLLQKDVAKAIGIELSTYGNYEQETRQVPDDIKIKLAEFYNVSLDYLITGKEREYMYQMPKKTEIEEIYSKLTPEEQSQARAYMLGMLSSRNDKKINEFIRAKIS